MTSAADLQAQNKHMTQEIYALLHANTILENEAMELTLECGELQCTGNKTVQTLEQEIQNVDKEITSLRLQCQSITDILKNADTENEIAENPALVPVSRTLSSAISHTFQRAKGISMPTRRRSSAVETAAHGMAKAASYIAPSTGKSSLDASRRPKMNKDSPAILSYAKSTRSLLFSTQAHYGNFRRRSGPCRKNRDPVMVL